MRFKAVPGREGDIWLGGGAEWDNTYGLWHSTDSGASFTKLANIAEADNVGFGKAATGQPYLTLNAVAEVASVRGIFRSTDAGQTWVRLNDDQHQWGHAGETAITGDPRIFGRVYVGANGWHCLRRWAMSQSPESDFFTSRIWVLMWLTQDI